MQFILYIISVFHICLHTAYSIFQEVELMMRTCITNGQDCAIIRKIFGIKWFWINLSVFSKSTKFRRKIHWAHPSIIPKYRWWRWVLLFIFHVNIEIIEISRVTILIILTIFFLIFIFTYMCIHSLSHLSHPVLFLGRTCPPLLFSDFVEE
jgi:hypothetical protein